MDDQYNRARFQKLVKELKQEVGKWYGQERNEYTKKRLQKIYHKLKDVETEIEYYVEDMNEMYLRNSSFPGDLIGWLDDDFTYDEPDDEDSDEQSDEESNDK
ncbi:MAG: hypothetical protein AAF653_20745 [Chloroflexota bacterium]